MGRFPSTKAREVLAALKRIGWSVKRSVGGSHMILERDGWEDYVWSFHDAKELWPVTIKRIAKRTGLTPDDM